MVHLNASPARLHADRMASLSESSSHSSPRTCRRCARPRAGPAQTAGAQPGCAPASAVPMRPQSRARWEPAQKVLRISRV